MNAILTTDDLIALWARAYRWLAQNPKTAARAIEIVASLSSTYSPRRGVRDAALAVLTAAEREAFELAVREDWRAVQFRQADMFAHRSRTLDELTAQFLQPAASTAFEAGEEFRPRFRSVGPIFISHPTLDTAVHAADFAKRLELLGIDCWYAPRNIVDGTAWVDELRIAAETCGEMLLLLSSAAFGSPWVRAEVAVAIQAGRRVLTFVMEPGLNPVEFNMGLINWQHFQWHRDPEAAFQALLKVLG